MRKHGVHSNAELRDMNEAVSLALEYEDYLKVMPGPHLSFEAWRAEKESKSLHE